MSRRRKRGDQHIRLHAWMTGSEAWRALSPTGCRILLDVWSRHNGVNNGAISYAARDAAEVGISRSAASRALKEITALGFVECTRRSGFSVKNRAAAEWRLTMEPTADFPATKEFMRWRRPDPLRVTAKFRTQSQISVTQSRQRDNKRNKPQVYASHSPASGTVSVTRDVSQSRQRDTYISTIGLVARSCARNGCTAVITGPRGRFCSPACRQAAHRARSAAHRSAHAADATRADREIAGPNDARGRGSVSTVAGRGPGG